jgi:hypothetical protein
MIFLPAERKTSLHVILKMKGYGMSTIWMKRFFLLAFVSAACSAIYAQEIVHAVTGVVTSLDPANNTITIKTNDGSDGVFKYQKTLRTNLVFDKEVRNGTTEPASFNKIGDHVVAYFVDQGFVNRTIVALKDFGPSALKAASGTVVKTKHHEIVLRTDAGTTEAFEIAKDASAETPQGVVSGFKFDVDPGTKVTVRYTEEGGRMIAQFIRNAFG